MITDFFATLETKLFFTEEAFSIGLTLSLVIFMILSGLNLYERSIVLLQAKIYPHSYQMTYDSVKNSPMAYYYMIFHTILSLPIFAFAMIEPETFKWYTQEALTLFPNYGSFWCWMFNGIIVLAIAINSLYVAMLIKLHGPVSGFIISIGYIITGITTTYTQITLAPIGILCFIFKKNSFLHWIIAPLMLTGLLFKKAEKIENH